MLISRRDFLAKSASLGTGLCIFNAFGQLVFAAPEEDDGIFAPPGEFKTKYFGRFSELPGWIGQAARGDQRVARTTVARPDGSSRESCLSIRHLHVHREGLHRER